MRLEQPQSLQLRGGARDRGFRCGWRAGPGAGYIHRAPRLQLPGPLFAIEPTLGEAAQGEVK